MAKKEDENINKRKRSKHLMNAYYVLGVVLSDLCALPHLILTYPMSNLPLLSASLQMWTFWLRDHLAQIYTFGGV